MPITILGAGDKTRQKSYPKGTNIPKEKGSKQISKWLCSMLPDRDKLHGDKLRWGNKSHNKVREALSESGVKDGLSEDRTCERDLMKWASLP